ncbi:DUF6628 family protein [Sphingomonas lycopersici]|uniref:Uncharacterized protein n=1 Tax=Sphingomonas lycopersici TaxID=2951807 RepID=A0AA42CTJ1_9SPHN|nr:DUF6628 family protein [Sphingomonas lycopersici]MCW6534426.1 hypothetical protein [Sphingomonas lycopersici]
MSLPVTAPLAALPHPLPLCPNARALLFAMRRMGTHGLADARAAHAIFTLFREGFRRPLTLLRALMADLAASAAMPIAIAPCCCARMTTAEAGLLAAIGQVDTTPDKAALLLSDLLGLRRADGVLASVAALAAAFADEGRPIGV